MNQVDPLQPSRDEHTPGPGLSPAGKIAGAVVCVLVVPTGVVIGLALPGVTVRSDISWRGLLYLSAAVMAVVLVACTYLYRLMFRLGVRSWLSRFVCGLICIAVMANHFVHVFSPWWGATLSGLASTIMLLAWVSLEARDERLSASPDRTPEP